MVWGSCPVLSPFLDCLSGSSELDWGSVELLRTYEECVLWFGGRSSSWPLPRLRLLGCSMLCHFVTLIPGAGVRCPFVSSRASWRRFKALLPCSSVCGLHCTGPPKRETIAMGDCYILCGWSVVTWFAWAAHRQRCEWYFLLRDIP